MLTATDGYLIAVAVVLAYAVAVYALARAGRIGQDRSLSLLGPALMLKTRRGLSLLDRVGRFRRAWTRLADLGIVLAGISMAAVLLVLLLDAVIALRVPAAAAPQPAEALGLPGINPIIPLGYGLVALVVGIVVHEFFHGVVARSQNVRVRSVGILWCVVPVGAFVEPDEEEMQKAKRRPRVRIAAAGVLANFGLTVLCFLLLAAVVTTSTAPNAQGVGVAYVLPGFPASNASLAAGDILTSVNGTAVPTTLSLFDALNRTTPNETIPIAYYSASEGRLVATNVTLTSASSYTHAPADARRGFLGVSLSPLTPAQLQRELAEPWAGPSGGLTGAVYWLVLPLAGFEPVQGTTVSYFHAVGPLAFLGSSGVWVIANTLYWLSWMNLLLGLSNTLPITLLDGGLLFRDFSGWLAERFGKGWNAARVEAFSGRATLAATFVVILLLLWQFIAPHL